MPLAKCVRCEKLFDKLNHPVCPACMPEEEEDYEKVRECLADHPEMSAEGISEITGVEIPCVMRMLDQGMISNTLFTGTIKCGRCGAPAISPSKRLCNGCLEKLNQQVARQRSQIQTRQRKRVQIGEYGGIRETIEEKRKLSN